jgi:hypothetical protein
MTYSNKHHSNYLSQADGPVLASDGLFERVAPTQGKFVIKAGDSEVSGDAISFAAILNTGIIRATIRPVHVQSPIEVMKFQGACSVAFDGQEISGHVVSVSSNFQDSTFEISFMPDGDT